MMTYLHHHRLVHRAARRLQRRRPERRFQEAGRAAVRAPVVLGTRALLFIGPRRPKCLCAITLSGNLRIYLHSNNSRAIRKII